MNGDKDKLSADMREAIEVAAASWLVLRDRGMSTEETTAFMHWLQEHPAHGAVFSELDRSWRAFDPLIAVPAPGAAPDANLLSPRFRARPSRIRRFLPAILAAAAAIAVTVAVHIFSADRDTFETPIGASRRIALADGSVANLNTNSAMEIEFKGAERRVTLLRGEVFFNVAKDSRRPFVVAAGPLSVRAVGTAFNVKQQAGAIEVLVTEGAVRVDNRYTGQSLLPSPDAGTSAQLIAGDRARVILPKTSAAPDSSSVEVARLSGGETRRALAWQERRLDFDSTPLSEAVAEFNRYNETQLVLADSALARRKFSGSFRPDNLDSFVRLLELDFGVQTRREPGKVILMAGLP